MNPPALLQKAKQELKETLAHPYQESLWILAHVLNLPPGDLYLERESLRPAQQELFWSKIQKRKRGAPLEYILRETIFFNKKLYIEEGVFIPRPETEAIVKWAAKNISDSRLKAVDFGAGSGALGLAILSLFPKSKCAAFEISGKSIQCLKKNRKAFQAEKRLAVLQKDVSRACPQSLARLLGGPPSLIVANPPYIDPKDPSLSQEVYFFEPPLAIFSDQKGMGHIGSWLKKAMECLKPRGVYIFEFGWKQLEPVQKLCDKQEDISFYEIHKDESGKPRLAVCFKK